MSVGMGQIQHLQKSQCGMLKSESKRGGAEVAESCEEIYLAESYPPQWENGTTHFHRNGSAADMDEVTNLSIFVKFRRVTDFKKDVEII
jgi:hypothetical protein